jgi:hypothetical protein
VLKEVQYKLSVNEVRRLIVEYLKEKDKRYNEDLLPRMDITTKEGVIITEEEDEYLIQLSTT